MLTQVLKLIDNHDLYGSVAYPKRHTQKDISDIYRLALATHGVFTNVALQEPFGLTVIEVNTSYFTTMWREKMFRICIQLGSMFGAVVITYCYLLPLCMLLVFISCQLCLICVLLCEASHCVLICRAVSAFLLSNSNCSGLVATLVQLQYCYCGPAA